MIINGIDYTGCRVTLDHVVKAKLFTPDNRGYCVPGMRAFAKANGLDFGKFAREGIPLEDFIKFKNDDMAKKVIQEAKKQWAAEVAL